MDGTMREPPRYRFQLEDLRAWHLVEASCRRCPIQSDHCPRIVAARPAFLHAAFRPRGEADLNFGSREDEAAVRACGRTPLVGDF